MDWGAEHHSQGNLGRGLGLQENQGTHYWEGARGGGLDCHRNLFPCAYMDPQRAGRFWCRLQVVPLDLATGKWAPLVRATGSWEPLVWPEGSGGLNNAASLA